MALSHWPSIVKIDRSISTKTYISTKTCVSDETTSHISGIRKKAEVVQIYLSEKVFFPLFGSNGLLFDRHDHRRSKQP